MNAIAATTKVAGMKIAEKLAKLREDRGLTIIGLANRLGLHKTQIDRYEDTTGTRGPTYDRALLIARFYRVPLEWLCDDEAPWPPPVGQTEKEQALWLLVRTMGVDEALARLAGLPSEPRSVARQGAGPATEGAPPPPGQMAFEKGPKRPRIRREDNDAG